MKRNFLTALCTMLMACSIFSLNAQKLYDYSVGGVGGSMWGGSFQTYLLDNLALGVDLGVQLTYAAGQYSMNGDLMTLQLNPNAMYAIDFTKNLNGLFGGGVSLGYGFLGFGFNRFNAGKFGINALAGVEYKFDIPLVIQADLRPGYGLMFGGGTWNYFDWSACITARYILK